MNVCPFNLIANREVYLTFSAGERTLGELERAHYARYALAPVPASASDPGSGPCWTG